MARRHFGSVRKRASGRWQASYWNEGRRHVAPVTFAAKADASAYLSTVEADIRRGAWLDPRSGQVTLTDYAGQWLTRRPDLATRTAELYRHLLDRHVLPSLGSTTLARLAPSQVRGWYAGIAQEHPTTAAKAYRLLSSIMRTAVTDLLIVASPCRVEGGGVERPTERPIATVAEVAALTHGMPERMRLVAPLACWCQLRRGELLGLRRRDIDLMRATITVEQARTFTMKGRTLTKGPKTSAGRRTLALPPNLTDDLADHLARFVGPEPDALVFTGEKGGPLTKAVLHKAWEQTRASIGRPDLRLHDLRHTGLTLAAATGATTAELMHRAGHASATAALRYQHATADRDRVLADALADLSQPADVVPLDAETRLASRLNRAHAPRQTAQNRQK